MSGSAFVIPNDMSDLCRVCLQLPDESQYLDLTTVYDEEDNLTYGECFTICTQIDLNVGEGVPHRLCKSCGIELQMSYDFHKKIEESKRVIEQYQRRRKIEVLNDTELLPNNEQFDHLSLNEQEKQSTLHVVNTKYVISTDELQTPVTSDMTCETETQNEPNFVEPSDGNMSDEVEIVNVCRSDESLKYEAPSNNAFSNAEMNDSFEDHFEIEALEDDEKGRKLAKNINTKKEDCNKQHYIQIKDECKEVTEAQPQNSVSVETLLDSNLVKIKCEVSNEYNDSEITNPLATNITAEDIKIENECIGEYIVSSVTEPTQMFCELISPLESLERQRLGPPFDCKFCGHSVPTKNSLYKHVQRKHRHEKHINQKPAQLPINCPFCGKVFNKICMFRLHISEKHSNKNFVCERCGHNLPTKNALCQHRLRKHPEIRTQKGKVVKFKCLSCSESFKTLEGLNLHKESKHIKRTNKTEQVWIECGDCGYKLPTKNALYQHRLRKHRNKKGTQKTFRCTYCETVLPSQKRLQKHIKELHEVLPALQKMVENL